MPLFSCKKCTLLFPSYAVCYAHMLDSPAHAVERAAAIAECGRRGLRSALEGMMTIMVEADAALSRAVIVAGREAIEDEEIAPAVLVRHRAPAPVPGRAARPFFIARVRLNFMHRYTADPPPAALRTSYQVHLRLAITNPAPTFAALMGGIADAFEAEAGDGIPVIWWGLMGQTAKASVWTAGMVVKAMDVRTDGDVRRMLLQAEVAQLHSMVLGCEE